MYAPCFTDSVQYLITAGTRPIADGLDGGLREVVVVVVVVVGVGVVVVVGVGVGVGVVVTDVWLVLGFLPRNTPPVMNFGADALHLRRGTLTQRKWPLWEAVVGIIPSTHRSCVCHLPVVVDTIASEILPGACVGCLACDTVA